MEGWQVFFGKRFLAAWAVVMLTAVLSNYWDVFYPLTVVLAVGIVVVSLADFALLFSSIGARPRKKRNGAPLVSAQRIVPERLSNGDDNEVVIRIKSHYKTHMAAVVYDEVPDVFQLFDFHQDVVLSPSEETELRYVLHPVERGTLFFRKTNVLVHTPLHFVERRFVCGSAFIAKVYPAFLFIKKQQLLSVENYDNVMGLKRVRRGGHSMEFDTIKEYVVGDDYRTINWKATARRHSLMVNQFEAEQSQQVYVVIDKGRGMQHAFAGMTLLDYAVNATVRLTYLALKQHDSVGLMTLGATVDQHVKASSEVAQMGKMMEALYALKTDFGQTDYSVLMEYERSKVGKRSLYVVFTSFSSLDDMRRQLPFLRHVASRHRVVLLFFEDADMLALANADKVSDADYATRILAEESITEKRLIAKELRRNGIIAILSAATTVNADTLNAYLTVKRQGAI